MRNTKSLALLAILAVVALIAGCGGSDDSSSSGDTLSVDDYGKQVSEEFASFNTDFSALGEQAGSPTSKDDYLSTVDQLQSRVGETIDNLKALGVPDEAQKFNDDAVSALEALQSSFDPIKEAVDSGDKTAVQTAAASLQAAAVDFQQKFTDLDKEAKTAGIPIDNLTGPAPAGG
ncbi:hypothetical protein BH10ACT11_BH10ACT11_01400 [soil metagenome]